MNSVIYLYRVLLVKKIISRVFVILHYLYNIKHRPFPSRSGLNAKGLKEYLLYIILHIIIQC